MDKRMNRAADGVAGDRLHRPFSFQTIQTASVFILLVGLCIVSSLRTETFFTWRNLVDNLLTNAAATGVIACGMTLVMITGGFDLSVASITAVCGVAAILVLQTCAGQGPWTAIPLALGATLIVGTALGATNGALIAYAGVNPFVVTLSTMLIFRGIALVITHGGQTIMAPLELAKTFRLLYWGRLNVIGDDIHRLSMPIIVFAALFLVFHVILRYTRYGHYVYAVGGNETASWLAGINTPRVKATAYTLCGFTCAISALISTSMSNTAQAASYQGLEMIVIASVIVGGTPLGGGSGNLWYTLNGLLLLSVIENLLSQYGISEEYRNIVRGLIILIVVTVDVAVRRSSRKRYA